MNAGDQASIRKLSIKAAFWTMASVGGLKGLRFLSSIVMTRLLFREAYGLLALANAFVRGVRVMSDLGVGPSIVQSKRGDEPEFLNTAWTMQIARGLLLYVVCLAVAIPAARFYQEDQLRLIIPVLGITVILAGFESVNQFTLNRKLILHRLTALDLICQVLSISAMILWAYLWRSVWALVAGALVFSLTRCILSHFLIARRKSRVAWEWRSFREIFRFGKWIFLASAIGFLAGYADRLILGKLFSTGFLGLYHIAFMLASIPDELMARLGVKVLFPAVVKLIDLPRETLRKKIERNRWPLLLGLILVTTAGALLGDILIVLVYDARYWGAGWILTTLSVGLWPRLLANTMGPVLLALGQPKYLTLSGAARLALLCVGVPWSYAHFGQRGAIVAIAVSGMVDYAVESVGLMRNRLLLLKQDIQATLLWLGVLTICCWIRWQFGLGIPFLPS